MAKKIILIHGLGGTADGTWGEFPNFLEADSDINFDIVSCGYESPALWKFWKRAPSILNIANGVLTDIRVRCDIENDEIILAGHSLGGIIVKKVLLLLQNKRISHKIFKVCFFDVPHDGSGYANAGKYVSRRNRHLRSLTRDSSELDDLNEQWVNSGLNNELNIISIISANDDIVSSSSSKSIFREHPIETINDVDHRTIVKPESVNSSSYLVFKSFVLKKNTVTKYKNPASRDLEEWKRIERNHSYHYATDENRAKDLESLTSALGLGSSVIRLTGASGLGKTRLLLEAIDASESIDDSCMLIFNAPGYDTKIKETIRSMVEDRADGLVVIENCSVDLHNHLAKEVNTAECLLKLVTIGYSNEQVDDSIHIILSPLRDEAIKQILSPILVGLNSSEVDRVARFAQGYPLMATLIAEQYQEQGRLLGSIEKSSVVKKLIEGDSVITDAEKEVLSACSLFDVFGTAEGSAGEEAKFIAEDVAGFDLRAFDRVLTIFTKRQIINRAGRYARVVPKPLALTLASEWWEKTSYDRQKQLIDTLPDSLMQSFCTQASYLDGQPSVQRFSDRLFGGQSPFVQAEELLTERGSKLFRAFVEVNPESTSDALYRLLVGRTHEQLLAIDSDTRRNLVWALEKLCFHAAVFEKSSWCLLLLASAENENWSNNATGMFSQLFRVHLSGTQAKPNVRFDVLKRAIGANQLNIDLIILNALEQAISTYGGSRTVGAEYQGTKAPLEEWRANIWQEIFDFWQEAFNLILALLDRGEAQRKKVLSIIGYSIRGFISNNRIEMLDVAIKKVISVNGRYWPEALDSIKNTIEYDSEGMKPEASDALNSWLELLSPVAAELPEKLTILVANPPWEHRKGDDDRYVDVAAENAKALARELSSSIDKLLPHLDLLLVGEQKQSYAFGYQLALILEKIEQFLDNALHRLAAIEHPNPQLVFGLYRGLFERSPVLWQEYIDRLLVDKNLIRHYPNLIRTGSIHKAHLDTLLELIQDGVLSANDADLLSYGSVTDGIEPSVMAGFCLQLAEFGDQASWTALNVIYMYCFGNEGRVEGLRDQLKLLVTAVPLHKGQQGTATDLHHWHDLAGKLLKVRDPDLAHSLTNQLIESCKYGFHHGDIWTSTKPLMLNLMKDYAEELWPVFGDAIIQSEGMERYWLQQLLDRETGLVSNTPSVLSVIPVESVVEWCEKHPDIGPVFVARCLNIFEIVNEIKQPSVLFIALLDSFGNDKRVAMELSANFATRGWSGSLVPYLESDKAALIPLTEHESPNVRCWVKDQIAYIELQITEESKRDEEHDFGLNH
ncbi:esterase/lipase family protein [Pseudomonas sp. LjRoot263]|uniref:esterase/lipase family protein n=1 Tax=Pseudomonas sp. LjRoot263 TaxID=3342302 RepID=UPI003ECC29D0